jgi:hypothetical protein
LNFKSAGEAGWAVQTPAFRFNMRTVRRKSNVGVTLTIRNPRFCSAVATLVAAMGASFLVGCATSQERRPETLSSDEFRMFYPRQYLDSLDPLERRNEDRRMMEEELKR